MNVKEAIDYLNIRDAQMIDPQTCESIAHLIHTQHKLLEKQREEIANWASRYERLKGKIRKLGNEP